VADAGADLLVPLQEEVWSRSRGLLGRDVPIVEQQVADKSGIIGAAGLVMAPARLVDRPPGLSLALLVPQCLGRMQMRCPVRREHPEHQTHQAGDAERHYNRHREIGIRMSAKQLHAKRKRHARENSHQPA
jgi:hypothetical protein